MENEWKEIKGFEGLYEVSRCGDVRSLKRHSTSGKVLKLVETKYGYYRVTLSKNNKKRNFAVHRLVADAFIENPLYLPCINHKNEIKHDNRAENLEWCDVAYNNAYNGRQAKIGEKKKKKIVAYKNGSEIVFDSIKQAATFLRINRTNIIGCLHGYYGRKTVGGYSFKFFNDGGIR